jgi:dienelactone hydrolase
MESPMIVVDQPDALIDQPIAIALRGFAPRQLVSVTATQTYAEATRWQSRATFISDNDGQVDVTRQAPVSGTYEGVAPMGLFWSMDRLPSEARPAPPGAIMLPVPIRLEAEGTDGRRAEITILRRVAGPGVTRHVIRTDGLVGTLFLPPGAGPHPAVLVVSGGGGGIDEFRGAILASHGYAALALGHFAVESRPRGLVNIPLEYFETAIGWMRAQPWFDDRLLAVWGASRGGELALLLGATFPEINAVAAWVPSGVVFWALGLAEPGDTRPPVAWTFRGKPLPYLQENNASGDPPPVPEPGRPVAYAPFYRSQLRDARAVERATIPVEKIRGPVQLVSGVDDQMWPSSDLADIALRRLETHRHLFPFRHLKYPEAGHTILVPYWPLPELRVLTLARVEGAQDYLLFQGGTAKADAEAGIDAWRDLLAFLDDAKTLGLDLPATVLARADEMIE